MAKVAYLFGAGASAQCIPVIKSFPSRFAQFAIQMDENRSKRSDRFPDLPTKTIAEIEVLFVDACKRLAEQCRSHASIDTYAKKLFITGNNEEYLKMKIILSCFLLYEQSMNPVDSRYDSFFASILGTHPHEFLGDIGILSWNYDNQFELAYSQYSNKTSIYENQLMLGMLFQEINAPNLKRQGISIFKLNGSSGYSVAGSKNKEHLFSSIERIDISSALTKFVWYFASSTLGAHRVESSLSFAWEQLHLQAMDRFLLNIGKPEALVIVGYSFPFFNREIDRKIITSLSHLNSTKIYVQDLDPKPIVQRLSSMKPPGCTFDIIPIDTADQFYLPAEL